MVSFGVEDPSWSWPRVRETYHLGFHGRNYDQIMGVQTGYPLRFGFRHVNQDSERTGQAYLAGDFSSKQDGRFKGVSLLLYSFHKGET